MKKQLLFAAAMFVSIAASAQTVVYPCTSTSEDGKKATAVNNDATIEGSTSIEAATISWGSGVLEPSTCQKTHKNVAGESLNYFGKEGTTCVTKWVPVVASDAAIKKLDDAYAAGQYIDFKISETDQSKYLDIKSIAFNAARYGTDAVRINAKLLIGSDGAGETETEWLFTGDTWESYTGGEGFWTEATGAEGEIPGYGPAREDASKANTNDKNEDGFSNIVIPTSDIIPADAYEVTLRICFYGIGNNKALGLNNVTFTSENLATGVENVRVATPSVDARTYNLGGRAAKSGLLIQKGKKYVK